MLGKRPDGVELRLLTMRHPPAATVLVEPGAWGLPSRPRRCVLGAIRADLGAFPIVLSDCVVDGSGARLRVCGADPGGTPSDAVAARTGFAPAVQADGVTFVGAVRAESADAVDCLFAGGIDVVQQQEGCLRNCFLGPDLTSPPSLPVTYRCGPFPAPTFASIGFEAAGYYALDLGQRPPAARGRQRRRRGRRSAPPPPGGAPAAAAAPRPRVRAPRRPAGPIARPLGGMR